MVSKPCAGVQLVVTARVGYVIVANWSDALIWPGTAI
jgi:hypothetical protein